MPWLSVKEAAGLREVCKALKVLVMGWPMKLIVERNLEAALRCFPAAECVLFILSEEPLAPVEESRVVELLRGHGGTLKKVMPWGEGAERLLSSAVRAGVLPSLTSFHFSLDNLIHREILLGGILRLVEEVDVMMTRVDQEQLAALGHLRDLPHLRRLSLSCNGALEAAFPPFIPPSLKALNLDIERVTVLESLLRGLPSMLQASGATLEAFELRRTRELSAEGGAALVQVLRSSSSTLKIVDLQDYEEYLGPACIRDLVLCLMRCCNRIEVLHCPWAVFSALPATCPAFPRLKKLHLHGGTREAIDLASPALDTIASGRLPALATLDIRTKCDFSLGGPLEGEETREGVRRLARALGGVAGTLRRLSLQGSWGDGLPAGAYHELGAAIGKLRRLRHLELVLPSDGRDCAAVGRGLAASGGCPELSAVGVWGVKGNLDWLTQEPSLIVPSVRKLVLLEVCGTEEEALLLCCGLVQMGYKHRLYALLTDTDDQVFPLSHLACLRAIVRGGGMNADVS
jgi:hypothetical protein